MRRLSLASCRDTWPNVSGALRLGRRRPRHQHRFNTPVEGLPPITTSDPSRTGYQKLPPERASVHDPRLTPVMARLPSSRTSGLACLLPLLLLASASALLIIPSTSFSPSAALSSTSNPQRAESPTTPQDNLPLPLIIWHGLGDNFASDGLREISALAAAVHPGTFVHVISLAENDAAGDRQATWVGNVTEQVATVCATLAAHPVLAKAPAVDALGFSQGGQFLRAYVQRCNAPRVCSLVTFGSQHNGIAKFRACAPTDWLCRGAMLLLRSSTWSSLAQARLVPAQYFRDPAELEPYLAHSNFLADINNERGPAEARNETYRRNLASLANLVLYKFDADTTVVPRETSWFDEVDQDGVVVPLRDRAMYRDDWLGLRQLDEGRRLFFRSLPGDHMDIPTSVLNDTMAEFFGPLKREGHLTGGHKPGGASPGEL